MPARRKIASERVLVLVGRIVLFAGLLVAWQLLSDHNIVKPFFASRPTDIASRIWDLGRTGGLWKNLKPTLAEAAVGFAISAVVGIAIGILLARVRYLELVTRPLLDVLNTLPRIALAPLFVLWFGLGFEAKIFLIVSVVIFAFIINTYSGVKSVNPDYVRMAQSLGATRIRILQKIVLPSITPWLFAAIRFGIAYSFATAVVAEIVSANHGLGYLISYSAGTLDTTGEFAALVILAIVAMAIQAVLVSAENHVLRWRRFERGSTGTSAS